MVAGLVQGAEGGRLTLDLSGPGWKLWRDKDAAWKTDHLFLRHEASGLFKRDDDPTLADPDKAGSITLGQLPVNPPTGGWEALDKNRDAEVSVPGTLEEYLWGKDGSPIDEKGYYWGVSWWWREFTLPADLTDKRVMLQCASTRLRSEIFIDGKLCGYDMVGNTPYEFDVTPFVQGGGKHRIAFRITNPGGSFGWSDNPTTSWGDTKIRLNLSHGFGGITGPVALRIVDAVRLADLWIRNTPALREIIPTITVDNTSGKEVSREMEVVVRDASNGEVKATARKALTLPPGTSEAALPVSLPDARLWSPDSPNLYSCSVALKADGAIMDSVEKSFGCRWFDVKGIGSDSQFQLNGRRVRVISAISWGFWPQTGIVATPELAAKQVATAKKLGLNCLNHHRTIGDPTTLDEADRQGLMYYEECGGFEGYKADAFAYEMSRQKFLRMVTRDRSRPSVIHYNMCNEPCNNPTEGQKRVMLDAHQLDPTRTITWGSGSWAGKEGHDPAKLWMKPLDMAQYDCGWRDQHHAGLSDAYLDSLYNKPGAFHLANSNRTEIIFWGEEGAIGTPPRLQLLKDRCSQPGHRMGWDGDDWLLRYGLFHDWLKDSGMGKWFTVDSMTQSAGDKQYYYQGRMIENFMIDDCSDGYVINGLENDKEHTMSGILDLWRNPKTDNLDLIRAYTRPLYVAVKLREKIAHIGEAAVADFWIVNEKDVKGEADLQVEIELPSKKTVVVGSKKVRVSGGDRYGELLQEAVTIPVGELPGYCTVRATLVQDGKVITRGSDQLLAVDWKSAKLPARGAVLETDGKIAAFLKVQKGVDVPAYAESLGKLDYVVVGRSVEPTPEALVGGAAVRLPDGSGPGLLGEYFNGKKLDELVMRRTDAALDFDWKKGMPDPRLTPENTSMRWTGTLKVPETGWYEFGLAQRMSSEVWINNKSILRGSAPSAKEMIFMKAGGASVKIVCSAKTAQGKFQLRWRPAKQRALTHLDSLLRRAREAGTTVIFLDPVLVGDNNRYNDELPRMLVQEKALPRFDSVLGFGPCWLGGSYIAGAGPLFEGLPQRQAFSWEYQLLAQSPSIMNNLRVKRSKDAGNYQNIALRIPGVETLVGALTDWNFDPNHKQPGTAVGVIHCGKGKIVLSTLPILHFLESERGAANVVKKLLCNMIQLAAEADKAAGNK
jgi:hypothetical protein